MKNNFFLSVSTLFATGILLVACQEKSNSVQPNSTVVQNVNENQSEIDYLEQSTGITYYKKDLMLHDAISGSKITLRFASTDKNLLNSQLEKNTFTLQPITNGKRSTETLTPAAQGIQAGNNNNASIIIEPISVKLAKGALGYTLGVKSKDNTVKGAKAAAYANHWEVLSPVWTEWIDMQVLGYEVEMTMDYKYQWNTPWHRYSEPRIFQYNPFMITHSLYIDGPYKHKAHVFSNYPANYWSISWRNDAA